MKVLCVCVSVDKHKRAHYTFPMTSVFFSPVIIFGNILSLCLFADGKEESLLEKRRELSREVSNLGQNYERLVSRFPNLRFEYKWVLVYVV